MNHKRILLLGGSGTFGKRLAENLISVKGITLIIAGRTFSKVQNLCDYLSALSPQAHIEAARVDTLRGDFPQDLSQLTPFLVINCTGPYQWQDYSVPAACIDAGCHYIDLADDREFVCHFHAMNDSAVAKGVLAVTGASSVPGLSSAVIDHFHGEFSSLEKIEFAIAPGNRAERGPGTVSSILSALGHPFPAWKNHRWHTRHGWMSPRRWQFGKGVGRRWLSDINIPDLGLFPERYPGVATVNFKAGLELPVLHWATVVMAWISRLGLVKDWSRFSKPILRLSELFIRGGTDIGGMQVNLYGKNAGNTSRHLQWQLTAKNGIGPYIPTLAATILAGKLIHGKLSNVGAMPCLGLFSLREFDDAIEKLDISTAVHIRDG